MTKLAAAVAPPDSTDLPCLGTNTLWTSAMHYSSAYPFTNLLKQAEPFAQSAPGVPLDAAGYPTSIPAGQPARSIITTGEYLPNGAYTVAWEGSGSFSIVTPDGDYTFDAQTTSPQTIQLNYYGTETFIELVIDEVAAGDHLRNMRLYLPGYDDDSPWITDHYRDFVSEFSVFRPVWWLGIIYELGGEPVTYRDWAQRPQVSDYSWGVYDTSFGVPYEVVIQLCNQTMLVLRDNLEG